MCRLSAALWAMPISLHRISSQWMLLLRMHVMSSLWCFTFGLSYVLDCEFPIDVPWPCNISHLYEFMILVWCVLRLVNMNVVLVVCLSFQENPAVMLAWVEHWVTSQLSCWLGWGTGWPSCHVGLGGALGDLPVFIIISIKSIDKSCHCHSCTGESSASATKFYLKTLMYSVQTIGETGLVLLALIRMKSTIQMECSGTRNTNVSQQMIGKFASSERVVGGERSGASVFKLHLQ